jgi:hypothetical protein
MAFFVPRAKEAREAAVASSRNDVLAFNLHSLHSGGCTAKVHGFDGLKTTSSKAKRKKETIPEWGQSLIMSH